jgi:hypothetical protein
MHVQHYIPSSNLFSVVWGNYGVIYDETYSVIYEVNYEKIQGLEGALKISKYPIYVCSYPANTLQAACYLIWQYRWPNFTRSLGLRNPMDN